MEWTDDPETAVANARLANSPFLKVEATKFTEVGYVGRDVESMVRDLVDASINMVRGGLYNTTNAPSLLANKACEK